jgi:hypothetical protein
MIQARRIVSEHGGRKVVVDDRHMARAPIAARYAAAMRRLVR